MFKTNRRMAKTAVALLLVVVLVLIPMTIAFAAQPGVECDEFLNPAILPALPALHSMKMAWPERFMLVSSPKLQQCPFSLTI